MKKLRQHRTRKPKTTTWAYSMVTRRHSEQIRLKESNARPSDQQIETFLQR